MKLNLKKYQIKKTSKFLKKKKIFLIFNGVTRNIKENIGSYKQKLEDFSTAQYKIFNRTALSLIKDSIFKNSKLIIHCVTFFVESNPLNFKKNFKKYALHNFKKKFFNLVGVRINYKIYSTIQSMELNSFKYTQTKTLFFQFNIKNVKYYLI